jgi:hypothetical protein
VKGWILGKEYQARSLAMGSQSPRTGLPFSVFAEQGVRGTVPLPRGSQRGSVVASRPHPPRFVHALRCRELSTTDIKNLLGVYPKAKVGNA